MTFSGSVKPKFTAQELKAVLVKYYLRRGMIPVTEFFISDRFGIADVFAFHPKSCLTVEVEIKVSTNDLYSELSPTNGKMKHKYYGGSMGIEGKSPPNLFYFCVPYTIIEAVRDILERARCQHAGLMVCDPRGRRGPATSIRMVKIAPPITKKRITGDEMYETMMRIALRAVSENADNVLKLWNLRNKIKEKAA